MSSILASDPTERTFLFRVVRGVGWVCLFVGAVSALQFAVLVTSYDGWFGRRFTRSSAYPFAYSLSAITDFALQLVGSVQLLRWKRSGRTILLVWAWLSMALSLVVIMSLLAQYVLPSTATTQPGAPSPLQESGRFILGWMMDCAPELLVISILSRREVAALWANPSTINAFEVVPMARPVEKADFFRPPKSYKLHQQ